MTESERRANLLQMLASLDQRIAEAESHVNAGDETALNGSPTATAALRRMLTIVERNLCSLDERQISE